MKIYKYITSVALLSFCFLSACNKPTETKIPVPVIFDTDVGNDIDDVLAMQMLLESRNNRSARYHNQQVQPLFN